MFQHAFLERNGYVLDAFLIAHSFTVRRAKNEYLPGAIKSSRSTVHCIDDIVHTMESQRNMNVDATKIAIIGMGCRLPGDAVTLESFWELLIQGRSSWSEVPPERWNSAAYYHPSGERKGTVGWYP